MSPRRWRLLLLLVTVLVSSSVVAQERAKLAPPSAEELLADVRALTAPEMEGRGAGTPGGDLAGRYIADRLAAMGFRPGGDGGTYLQSFVLSVGTRPGAGTTFEILGPAARTLALGSDWTPYGGSAADDASGGVVFVGYGMVVGERGYDDYAGVDVRGKIALALAGPTEGTRPSGVIAVGDDLTDPKLQLAPRLEKVVENGFSLGLQESLKRHYAGRTEPSDKREPTPLKAQK